MDGTSDGRRLPIFPARLLYFDEQDLEQNSPDVCGPIETENRKSVLHSLQVLRSALNFFPALLCPNNVSAVWPCCLASVADIVQEREQNCPSVPGLDLSCEVLIMNFFVHHRQWRSSARKRAFPLVTNTSLSNTLSGRPRITLHGLHAGTRLSSALWTFTPSR